MQLLLDEIRDLTEALAGLRPDNIVIDNLDNILGRLKASDLGLKITQYKKDMLLAPNDDLALEKHNEIIKGQADLLNKEADHFLDELERIKKIRQTLNLEALDPIIKEARTIIHSLHSLTAGLEEE
jgi:hypothetical protein